MNNNFDAAVHYSILCALIFTLSLLFGAFGEMNSTKKKVYLICTFSVFFIIIGFRSIDMGNDTRNYIILYKQIASFYSLSDALNFSGLESGYVIYNWCIAKIFGDARYFLLITSLIMNLSISRFIYKYVDCPGIFCFLFVSLLRFDFFMSIIRQGLSIVILLYAVDFLIQKKKMAYILTCVIACLFHTSAIVMLLVYPFIKSALEKDGWTQKNFIFYLIMFSVLFVSSLFLDIIVAKILFIVPKYGSYIGTRLFQGEPRLAAILGTLVACSFFLVPKILTKEAEREIKLYNLTERMSFIALAVSFLSINATILGRINSTFVLYSYMYFSNTFKTFKREDRPILFALIILCSFAYGLILVLLKTPSWQTTYPIDLTWKL